MSFIIRGIVLAVISSNTFSSIHVVLSFWNSSDKPFDTVPQVPEAQSICIFNLFFSVTQIGSFLLIYLQVYYYLFLSC